MLNLSILLFHLILIHTSPCCKRSCSCSWSCNGVKSSGLFIVLNEFVDGPLLPLIVLLIWSVIGLGSALSNDLFPDHGRTVIWSL